MPTVILLIHTQKPNESQPKVFCKEFGGSALATFYNKENQEQTAQDTRTTASEALCAISCICTNLFGPSMTNPQSRIPPSSILTRYNCISLVTSTQIEAQPVVCARETSSTVQIEKDKKRQS